MLTGTGLRVFMDKLELQHVNSSLSLKEMTAMQADLNRSQPAGCPHPSHPGTQTIAAFRFPQHFGVTSCAQCHVWPGTLHRDLCGTEALGKEGAAGQGCHTLLGQDKQGTGGSPALCPCSATPMAGAAAEAVLATLPVFLFQQGSRGEQAADSLLLRGAGQLIYANYLFGQRYFKTQNCKT